VTVFSPLDKRFDSFLYASVLERDGLPVSVLSALTRQNLDPWEEATRLAGLPRDQAVECLAATIWRSSSMVSRAAASEIALQLVELLPTTASAGSLPHGSEDPVSLWLVYAIFLFMMAISANTNLQTKKDQAQQASAIGVGQTAKAPSDTIVLMQPRK
jgi:hypothetical protein